MLVRMMEKMMNRREGKKSRTMKGMRKEKEEMKKKEVEMEKKVEEEKKRADEEKRMKEEERKQKSEALGKNRELEERISRMREEMEEMKKKKEGVVHTLAPSNTPPITTIASTVITSLDRTSVKFTPNNDYIKREGNTIIHHGDTSVGNCFIGGEMKSV